jgi:hypothetical protein
VLGQPFQPDAPAEGGQQAVAPGRVPVLSLQDESGHDDTLDTGDASAPELPCPGFER